MPPDPTPQAGLARKLLATLPASSDSLFNPWQDACHDDAGHNGPRERRHRLAQHLACTPRLILCGEAPGYMGARISGIAFTSEKLLLNNAIPRVTGPWSRLSTRERHWSEPSATIVWRALHALGRADDTLLWNALQLHPHRPGKPLSNRTPTDEELQAGKPALQLLAAAFPQARWVAVGRKAEHLLEDAGIASIQVRHPANGGARAFARGLGEIAHQRQDELG